MSTLLIKRSYRVLMLSMASLLIASMLAPIVAVANTELVAGDTAIVSNPDGSGAYLRTDTTVLDETTISAELPQGSSVWVMEDPVYNDTGVWVYVAADGYGPGWISTSLLQKVATDEVTEPSAEETVTEDAVESEPVTSELAWLEPIDDATVVDYNNELPVEGLAVRASIDGPILGYAVIGGGLDVTGDREWVGEANFVRVNFNGVGGYVHGDFVELASEVPAEAPTEEVIWVEPTEEVLVETEVVAEVVTEEVPVETEVVAEVVTEEVPVETEVVAEVVTEEVPVETEVVAEVLTEEVPAETEIVAEVVTEEVPAETEVVAEVVTEEVPVETEVVAEVVTEEVPVETEVVAEVVTEEVPVETEEAPVGAVTEAAQADPVTKTVAANTELVADEDPAGTEATTEEAAVPATPAVTDTEAPAAVTVTVAVVATTQSTEAATTVAAAATAPAQPTAVPTEVTTPAPIASTATKFDDQTMIGSATVTGTSSGLLCRAEPNPASPVLMTLAEGTKVLVSAEAVNGYLGIDCGGLQGFADVNYLWSGGAGDGDINAARMSVVVTGTGNGLNCRTGAGTSNSIITTIYDGTSLVTRGAASNGWTPVICAGQNGFVSTTWIEAKAGSTTGTSGSTATTGTAKVNAGGDGLYCRSGAGTSYGVITVLGHGSSVAVRGAKQGDWVPVTCGGKAGFAHEAYLSMSAGSGTAAPSAPSTSTGSVTVANTGGQGLNCRAGSGTTFSIITTLSLGQSVKTRSGSVNGWTAVICGGSNGFVSSEFVSGAAASAPAPAPTAPTPKPAAPSGMVNGDRAKVTSDLNLRYSASLTSSVATVLDTGVVIQVTGSLTSNFYPVNYDGLKGFVHKDYVVKTTDALSKRGGSASPAPSAPAPSTPSGSALVNYAMRYVGYPYVWATAGPASFDCSGFTYWVVKNVMGIDIGRGTWTQVAAGTPVSRNNLQPGDLVFHQNTYTAGLSHVSMYIGNNQMVNALNENAGVVVSDMTSDYWESRWYGAVRL